jgi:hypothetical protein
MEKLNGSEILEKISGISRSDLGYQEVNWDSHELGEVKVVDEYGGEGHGENWYVVYHFVNHDVYIRINGFYSSYVGAEFDEDPYEVRPKEKVVVFYE